MSFFSAGCGRPCIHHLDRYRSDSSRDVVTPVTSSRSGFRGCRHRFCPDTQGRLSLVTQCRLARSMRCPNQCVESAVTFFVFWWGSCSMNAVPDLALVRGAVLLLQQSPGEWCGCSYLGAVPYGFDSCGHRVSVVVCNLQCSR